MAPKRDCKLKFPAFSFHHASIQARDSSLEALAAIRDIEFELVEGNGIFVERKVPSTAHAARMWWIRATCPANGVEFVCCHSLVPPVQGFLKRLQRLEGDRHKYFMVGGEISQLEPSGSLALPARVASTAAVENPPGPSVCNAATLVAGRPRVTSVARVAPVARIIGATCPPLDAYVGGVVAAPTSVGARNPEDSPASAADAEVDCGSWILLLASKERGKMKARGLNYSKDTPLGEGSFGRVSTLVVNGCVAKDRVMKELKKSKNSFPDVLNELVYLEHCRRSSDHIVQLLDVFIGGTVDNYCFVLEYWGVSLWAHMKQRLENGLALLNRREIHAMCCHVCSGLAYLHSLRAFHGDVKPENILVRSTSVDSSGLGDFHCKLADLGSCHQVVVFLSIGFGYHQWPLELLFIINRLRLITRNSYLLLPTNYYGCKKPVAS